MPYIGNPIYQSAFVTDQFSGNGSTTAFTMSVAPAGVTNVLVAVSGVLQDPSTYGVSGNTLTFSAAPPSGTGNISCRYLGVPATGVVTTAYRTVTEFTATAGQTTFTPPSYTVNYINVYRNGVLLGSADYTATNGTTVVLATGATAGDLVTVESFLISSVLNALPQSGGTLSGNLVVTGTETVGGNLGVGTTNPTDSGLTVAKAVADSGYYVYESSDAGSWGASLRMYRSRGSSLTSPTAIQATNSVSSILFGGYNGSAYVTSAAIATLSPENWTTSANGTYMSLRTTPTGTTTLTEQMRINANGQITTPNQPCFNARLTSGNYSGTTTIVWNDVWVNRANCYNSSNGLFTAPIAGNYFFSCRMRASSGSLNPIWVKNGVDQAYFGTTSDSLCGTWVFALSAGDTVSVRQVGGGTVQGVADYHSVFNGYLLG